MTFAVDIISDLHLTATDSFNWEGKATSLFCVIAGNISNDMNVLKSTLTTLSRFYQGIFFIDGSIEHTNLKEREARANEILAIAKSLANVVYLHNNVVIFDGIAIVGLNGWYGNYTPTDRIDEVELNCAGYEDITYIVKTIQRLQLHIDVKHILVISNSVPCEPLFFGEKPNLYDSVNPIYALQGDNEKKITTWIFGSFKKIVETNINGINYFNNPCYGKDPYFAKRVEIGV